MNFVFAGYAGPLPPEKVEKFPHSLTETRLTFYLKLETWTPEQAAYLVNGIVPLTLDNPIYKDAGKVMNLAGRVVNSDYLLSWANILLVRWHAQANPPAKIRPIEFIAWCKSQGVDTGWITNAEEWAEYEAAQKLRPQAGPKAEAAGGVSLENDIEISRLLSSPLKKDDWFHVIDDTTRELFIELSKMPNEIQVWGRMVTNPPKGYEVTTGQDRGESCLSMPGVNSLSRSAFTKRWKNYTQRANKA
ncbi:hypothetical protein [Methylomonas koyamae]|uniref:hypothetical protein n=1 Tax=Methylomonas koyamae TaxID=702114 RepID=UPI00112D5DCE|nr:hypothetical protein [Methylomonas koyamae]TPQ27635.1 hypothetical protein C2U68_07965 [Methylomonas koyamae]